MSGHEVTNIRDWRSEGHIFVQNSAFHINSSKKNKYFFVICPAFLINSSYNAPFKLTKLHWSLHLFMVSSTLKLCIFVWGSAHLPLQTYEKVKPKIGLTLILIPQTCRFEQLEILIATNISSLITHLIDHNFYTLKCLCCYWIIYEVHSWNLIQKWATRCNIFGVLNHLILNQTLQSISVTWHDLIK